VDIDVTLIPADRHLATASGTAARGGSIIDMSPTKRRPVSGKFSASASNAYDAGNLQRWWWHLTSVQ